MSLALIYVCVAMLQRNGEKRRFYKCGCFLFCVQCYLPASIGEFSSWGPFLSSVLFLRVLMRNASFGQQLYASANTWPSLPFPFPLSYPFFYFPLPFSFLLSSPFLLEFLPVLVTPSHWAIFQSLFDMGWSLDWLIDLLFKKIILISFHPWINFP